ncbi:MAG: thiolase domain-containing protein [candidate division Zixibacteria bacterium]|nr:thiolase domain-containing protein [candidate division Zixibacteria bacterium]
MRDVAVVGIGMNKWGEIWTKSFRDLFVEAALMAIDDAGVDTLDSMTIGCMTGGLFVGQEHLASMMADYLGIKNLPASRVESACASGGLAFRTAYIEVASGMSDIVLAGGVEKMTDVSGDGATYALATAADQEYEVFHGATFPGLYALMAVAHMEKYGTTRDMLSSVAVKNHHNGSMNPNAQYPFKISIEEVNNSVMVASPLRILDCSPITDGAAAVILTTVDIARKLGKPIIKIIGSGHATDTIALHSRKDLTTLDATRMAAKRAFDMAGKTIKDIDFAEVHDCFTIAEIIVSESLGVFAPGKGGVAAQKGETGLEGSFPINTSGGLKSKGHPVGATGIGQAVEVVKQLRGEAENGRQLKNNPKTALMQNMGGSGGSTLVHILEVA